MGNEVTAQTGTKGLSFAVPAHIAARIKAAGGGNIPDKNTTNSVTFAGKAFTMHVNGDSKVLTRRLPILDDNNQPTGEMGEPENIQILRVVIIDWNKHKERSYYAGDYTGVARQPDCWSPDGVKPHSSVENPQSRQCDGCPMAAKDSRISKDGKGSIACGRYRVLAMVPEKDLDFPALKLKFKGGSDWDTYDEAASSKGWYGWMNYVDYLNANDLNHTGAIVTQIRFANTNHPQLQFKPVIENLTIKYLEEEEFDKIVARSKSEEVQKLLAGFNPAAKPQGKPLPKDEEPPAETPLAEHERKLSEQAAQKLRAAEEAEAARHAAAAAEAKALVDAKAERQRKVDEAKAAMAEHAARVAALEAEEGGFDDGPKVVPPVDTPAQTEEKKRTRRSRAEMEAVRAAEAAAKNNTPAMVAAKEIMADLVAVGAAPPMETPEVTTALLGAPPEIPAAFLDKLPAWE